MNYHNFSYRKTYNFFSAYVAVGSPWRLDSRISLSSLGLISLPSSSSVTSRARGLSFPFGAGETV